MLVLSAQGHPHRGGRPPRCLPGGLGVTWQAHWSQELTIQGGARFSLLLSRTHKLLHVWCGGHRGPPTLSTKWMLGDAMLNWHRELPVRVPEASIVIMCLVIGVPLAKPVASSIKQGGRDESAVLSP